MILDTHTQVWSSLEQLGPEISQRLRAKATTQFTSLDGGFGAHERAMNCVDGSLVMGFRSRRLDANVPNELIAEFVSKDPGRRIGICGVDPMADDALEQIETAHGLGLAGAVVSPACQGFHPAHSGAMRVYERCVEKGMPLFVTMIEPLTQSAVAEFGRPALWDEVAQSFPQLPIVIGRLGHPWVDETLMLLSKHPNLYADISGVASRSWQLYNSLLSAASMGVMDQLLFGSGFPFDTPAKAIETLYSVNAYSHGTQLPSVPRSLIRAIVERDSLACLGIESEISMRHRGAAAAAIDDAIGHELADLLDEPQSASRYRGRSSI